MIRALAVILVLSTHWGNNMSYWFGLGAEPETMLFLGTLAFEFFFVMSGFLIGCLLLDIVRVAPTWTNLLIFLVRRWMRTLPLYYLWLILLLVVFPPAGHVAEYAWRFATITQNFIQPMPEDYFYAVSWSLGIEEWFYLLFSSSMIICAMVMPKRIAVWVPLAVFFIVPPILRLQVPGYSDWSTGLAKVVIFRLDEIAYGVLMAHLYMRRSWLFRHPVLPFCIGISMIIFHDRILPPHYFFPFIFSLMALSCSLCLPLVLRLQEAPFWFTAIVRRLSAQSYGLYIMHLTILVDVAQGLWWRHLISSLDRGGDLGDPAADPVLHLVPLLRIADPRLAAAAAAGQEAGFADGRQSAVSAQRSRRGDGRGRPRALV